MSITAYTGLPGHGKSYGVVENVIIPAAKEGRAIYTNIPLNLDEFGKRYNVRPFIFDVDDYAKNPQLWDDVPPGTLFVLDEVWRVWPVGTTAKQMPESQKSFLAEHRHRVDDIGRSIEIVLVTQDLAQVASFVRQLVETTFRVTKLTKVGASKAYRVDVYSGCRTGSPPIKSRDREIPGIFKKDIYQLYQSHTQAQGNAVGNEKRADQRYNILKSGSLISMVIAIPVLFFLTYFFGSKLYASYSGDPDPAPQPVSQVTQSIPQSQPNPKTNPEPKPNPRASVAEQFLSQFPDLVIASQNRTYPEWMKFVFVDGDRRAEFSLADLNRLGDVSIRIVSDCAISITAGRVTVWAFCHHNERSDPSIFGVPVSNPSNQIN